MPVTQPQEYWFARRFPIGNPRGSMSPVHWKGNLMFGVFAASMALGAFGFALAAVAGQFAWGVIVFAALAAMGAGILFFAVATRGDQTKTVADYRSASRNA